MPRLALIVAVVLAALPSQAAAIASVTATNDSISISETTVSAVLAMTVTIDAGAAGPADDVLVADSPNTFAIPPVGCTRENLNQRLRCPLVAGPANRETVNVSYTGMVTTVNVTVTANRPDGDLTVAVTGSGLDSGYTFDATGTAHANVVLTGNGAGNTLLGGGGDDAISGGGGNDVMRGGPGDDVITPGGGATTGSETVDGGDGTRDVVSFAGETVPVTVSLDGVVNDGPQGRSVTITGVEDVTGGSAGDTIVGDGGANILTGLGGGDTLIGGGGAFDVLRGGLGSDTVNAQASPAGLSDVACGAGVDTAVLDAIDLVDGTCENVARAAAPAPPASPPPASPGAPGVGGADRAAPAVTVAGVPARIPRRRLLAGLAVRVAVSERCRLTVELVGTAATARLMAVADNLVLARRVLPPGTGTRTAVLRAPAGLLVGGRRLAVRVVAVDAAGNRRTVTRRLTVTG